MGDPTRQLNASAKSALFISVPRTLMVVTHEGREGGREGGREERIRNYFSIVKTYQN